MSVNNTISIIQYNINRYICPILLIFGIIGCLLNILLFSRKRFRTISCCTYFLSASVPMMILVFIGYVPYSYAAYHPNPQNKNHLFCKLRGYMGQSFQLMYRWIMTIACIDRYMVSSTNLYLRKFSNPRIAYSIVIKIMILSIILPLYNLIFLNVGIGWCLYSKAVYAFYHSLFTFILIGFLPIMIMVICTFLIHDNLRLKRIRRRDYYHYQDDHLTSRLLSTRDNQVLLMLFIQVIFYIISTIPWMIVLLYAPYAYNIKNKSIDRLMIEIFIGYLTELNVYLYPTLSFYIYTLTSKTFRRELFTIIYTLLTRRNHSQNEFTSSMMNIRIERGNRLLQLDNFHNFPSTEIDTSLNLFYRHDSLNEYQELKPLNSNLSPTALLSAPHTT
ncbi:unnamed protein product [Adineta steineri]|uniref:G-protein coupled receptors family 1 profile domain-containing protein n=1 Tax=Adineta steineri TaxID=433720 RepID=A0A815XRW2_9BILA|nr:unnamed protein product [Adineta steineri]CAF1561595.1 unnamed protein product [Adineta steineri]